MKNDCEKCHASKFTCDYHFRFKKWAEAASYALESGLTVYEAKSRLEEFQRIVNPQVILAAFGGIK